MSANDRLVAKGLQEMYPTLAKLLPLMAERGNHDTWTTSIIVGASFALAIVTTITTARIGIRWSRLGTLGADDVVIIPAYLSCIAYIGLMLACVTVGCLGRHVYTCTYKEMGHVFEVSSPGNCNLILH